MRIRRAVLFAVLICLSLTASPALRAQAWEGPAAVGVRVTDEDGQPIADAQIVARVSDADDLGPPATVTDAGGRAVVSGLREGEWFIEVSHPSYMLYAAYIDLRAGKKPVVGFSSQVNTATSWQPMTVKFQKATADFSRGQSTKRAKPKAPEVVRDSPPQRQPDPPKVVRSQPEPPKVVRPKATPEEGKPVPAESPTEAEPPVVDPPSAEVPMAGEPDEALATAAPVTEAPVTEAPATEAPATEAPVTETPMPEESVAEEPAVSSEPAEGTAPPADPVASKPQVLEEPVTEPARPLAEMAPVETTEEAPAAAPVEPQPSAETVPPPPTREAAPQPEDPATPPAAEPQAPPVATSETIDEAPLPDAAPSEAAVEETMIEEPVLERAAEEAPGAEAPVSQPAESPPTAPTESPMPEEPARPAPAEELDAAPTEAAIATERLAAPPAPAPVPAEPTPAPTDLRLPRFLRSAAAGTCRECEAGEWAVAAEQEAARAGDIAAERECSAEYLSGVTEAARRLADAPGSRLENYTGPVLTALFRLDESDTKTALQELLGAVTDPQSNCQMAGVVLPPTTSFSGYVLEAWDSLGGRACRTKFDCAVGQARWLAEPVVVEGAERTVVYTIFKNRSTRRERRLRMTIYFRPDSPDWVPRTR